MTDLSDRNPGLRLPLTVLVACKNEEVNLPRCLSSLDRAMRVVVLDSHSTDSSGAIALHHGAELVQFEYQGGYPKKRQWALDNLNIASRWVLLLDADEVIPPPLWEEISRVLAEGGTHDAYLVEKGFHFLGRRMRFGGFSHSAVLLFKTGRARFECLLEDDWEGLDMEVHERVLVDGEIGRLATPLIHEDFKGLEAYIERHNKYSTWEARLRYRYLESGSYGTDTIVPRVLGDTQQRRRFLKRLILLLPLESMLWFLYHYVARMGFLEGRAGLIACQIRSSYIAQVRAKVYELRLRAGAMKNR